MTSVSANSAKDSPSLTIAFDTAINYAFQQNAIPVIKELHFQNDATVRKDLVIRVTTEPAFAAPAELRIQSIAADGEFRVAPLDLKLSHDYLAGLNEKVSGWLKIEVLEGENVICSRTEAVSLLARNEWCGLVSLPEILAAFILPNDPAVMPILGRASELLRESTGRAALNSYQDKSRKRAWDQVAAIYKAIAELGIRYINPPASFENTGQKIRFPSDIFAQRFGTCLDLTLLFAACCEQAGLSPFILMHEGHAYAGCWLEENSLPEPAGEDLQQIRKLAEDAHITVFETTILAGEAPGTLNDAEMLGRPHLQTSLPFRLALDVHRARLSRIHPLPIPGHTPVASRPGVSGNHAPASDPGIGKRDFDDHSGSVTTGPAKAVTRIDQWKSRLLDLSLRNRLLNFKETKSTIRILSASPEHVEDELAAQSELSLQPKPKLMSEEDPRHAATYTKQQRADALNDHLRDELTHGRIRTNLEESEHARRLTELYRAARVALDENGTNTLFAAVGILEWRETEHSDRVLRAPILLVPVELKRKSVLEGFTLRRIDEETRLNVTLMEMLRQNFQKEIPGIDPLPEDDRGVNVTRVLKLFRDAVRDLVGWEVKSEIWLGQFSFTKFLLWKDIADRLEELTRNRIVNHLVHDAGTQYPNPTEDIKPTQLDDQFHPRDIYCPRSADSSQLAAVMAAAAGHDFVLEGPPGTGKSQTITNIIAHCLSQGKRVLFVAEKRAALDVVHRRLREDGLEPFCLELHSNKTGKADVLAQFDRTLKFVSESTAPEWEQRTVELEKLRASLNDYTRALHRRRACGLSAHHCLDYLLPRQSEPTVRLESWPSILETPTETLDLARQVARLLQERSRPLVPLADHALAPLGCQNWSPVWAERTLDQIRDLGALTQNTIAANRDLRTWLRFTQPAAGRQELAHLLALVECLLAPELVGAAFITKPWVQLVPELDLWRALAAERSTLREKLLPMQAAIGNSQKAVPLEKWDESKFGRIHASAHDLKNLTDEVIEAVCKIPIWSVAPAPSAAGAAAPTGSGNEPVQVTPPANQLADERRKAAVRLDHERFPHMLTSTRSKFLGLLLRGARTVPVAVRLQYSHPMPVLSSPEKISLGGGEGLLPCEPKLSRAQLHQLRDLADRLLSPLPVEPHFFVETWDNLAPALDTWRSLIADRTSLRARISYVCPPISETGKAACEDWNASRVTALLSDADALAALTRQATEATRSLRTWLQAPLPLASREELAKLVSLSDLLVSPAPLVTELFVKSPWPELATRFEQWISLINQRVTLRTKLAAYDESKLLALDLDLLNQKWFTGRDAWFLLRWLRVGSVRHHLQQARTDHFKPDVNTLEEVLTAALRLRTINRELADAQGEAASLLDTTVWAGGEPDANRLSAVREWGAALHEQLMAVGGGSSDWVVILRTKAWEIIKVGRTKGEASDPIARKLACFRDAIAQFDQSYEALTTLVAFNRDKLDHAEDHLRAVASALDTFIGCTTKLHAIQAILSADSARAQTALGTLWNEGEPSAESLAATHAWGSQIHELFLGFLEGDDAKLVKLRRLGTTVLAENTNTAHQKPVTRLLARFRDSAGGFDEAYDALVSAAGLNREPFDCAPDHLRALTSAMEVFLQSASRLRAINGELSSAAPTAHACLGIIWAKGEPDSEAIAKAIAWGGRLHANAVACAGDDLVWLGQLRQLLAGLFGEGPAMYALGTRIGNRLVHYHNAFQKFEAAFTTLSADVHLRGETFDTAPDYLASILALTERLPTAWPKIREWCSWQKVRQEGMSLGLEPIIQKLETLDGHALDLPGLFERSFRRALLFACIEKETALREFFGREHSERIERFREIDEKLGTLSRDIIRSRLASKIPNDHWQGDVPKTELGLLKKEINKKTRHIPVRQLLTRIPKLLPKLKPCVLMSPLSVAQYLDASHKTFDVVIFDEASQIPVWDAIGAIARGEQLIVVGDPKQLPPTDFFNNNSEDEDDRTPEEHKDLESILDELMTNGLRHKRLQWHYRSRHEGLITFSNRQYYDNDLLTFPSPEAGHGGVRFKHLPEARYDKGKSRTNRGEALALVDDLVARLRKTDGPRRSFGVVTFSQAQQKLVEDLLDQKRREHPEIELHFGDEPPVEGEPVFVKNLESVQGDERDVILFSICYGPDETGKVSMNFGPLNRDGGERRLNVAITRAKHEVLVFSGLSADQIDLTRTRAKGVRDLKYFLDYADRGPRALSAANSATGDAEPDSEFEKMVADRIRNAGYDVHHQVGCSGYRIDLAVVDPANPGRYLLGVECDGATYHRAATARDRDKLREMILEGLGWKLHRVWSTDWWHDASKETKGLIEALKAAEK